jgi:NTP pyrophosphatase (non-canonical NTP hydrolase)
MGNGTTLNEYQTQAVATLNQDTDLVYTTGKLQCEAGELSQYALKAKYHGKPLAIHAAIEELGDVLWYAAATAEQLGTTLEEVAQLNIAKLRERHGAHYNPEHYQPRL